MDSLFYIDTKPQTVPKTGLKKAAWQDADDIAHATEDVPAIDTLPKWARSQDTPSADLIIRDFVDPDSLVKQAKLKFIRSLDANVKSPASFHPTLDLCAVLEGNTVKLFNLGSQQNELLEAFELDGFRPSSMEFIGGGRSLAVVGNRPFVLLLCLKTQRKSRLLLPSGHRMTANIVSSPDQQQWAITDGTKSIFLLDSASNQFKKTFISSEPVNALSFSNDSSQLISCGGHGSVYIWDLKTLSCVAKFCDVGGPVSTAISLHSHLMAIGSNLGVVNLYEVDFCKKLPKLVKTVENLTTKISQLKFTPCGRYLMMATSDCRNGVRTLDLESGRVLSYWPNLSPPLGRVHAMDLNSEGTLLVIGNSKGSCLKFELLQ